MKERRRVIMLCGGQSPEHDVSISSARTCAANLSLEKYDLQPVCILRDGRWMLPADYVRSTEGIERLFSAFEAAARIPKGKIILPMNRDQNDNQELRVLPVLEALARIQQGRPDVVFILLHGPYGEDGTIQGLLEFFGLAYTCSGVLASSLAMDKIRCQQFLSYHGIPTPDFLPLYYPTAKKRCREIAASIEQRFGFPCIIKPSRQGSSVGMGIAGSAGDLPLLLAAASEYDDDLLIEEYIRGIEVTCGIIDIVEPTGELKQIALPPTEIVPKERPFFDYYSKYTPGKSEEITPARLPQEVREDVREISLKVYNLLGCRGMARVDLIVRDAAPYVLEINTIPGMTPTSLLPQGALAYGIRFPQLLDIILESTLRR
jgi:D-alanine-D-alanine ligase